MENPIKMDDLGVPAFLETPICKPSPLWLLLDGGVDPTALEGLNCQQELWNSIRWNFVSALNKKWQPIFFGRENETSCWIGFAWGGWKQNSEIHVPTLHGDEETSIFSKKGGSYQIIMAL